MCEKLGASIPQFTQTNERTTPRSHDDREAGDAWASINMRYVMKYQLQFI